MRVLIISSTVKQTISVGKITTELYNYLSKNNIETNVIYMDGKGTEPFVDLRPKILRKMYDIISTRTHYLISFSPYALGKIKRIIKLFKPNIIQLIQPLERMIDNKGLFKMLGLLGIPCVYTMIDEYAYLGDCDNAYQCEMFKIGCERCKGQNYTINNEDANYQKIWTVNGSRRVAKAKTKGYASIKNICFVAPEWVILRAKESKLLQGRKLFVVDEFINNNDVFYPQKMDPARVLENGINLNKIIILNVAKYSNLRKGLKYFVEVAKQLEKDDRFQFINVGYDGIDEELPSNYLGIPFVNNQHELAEFYSISDLYMITSLSDTMPNVCLEALSCGTPVCGFNVTGIPYVANEPLGKFVKVGDVEALVDIVVKTEKKTEEIEKKCREYALSRYAPEVFGNKMISIYKEMQDLY